MLPSFGLFESFSLDPRGSVPQVLEQNRVCEPKIKRTKKTAATRPCPRPPPIQPPCTALSLSLSCILQAMVFISNFPAAKSKENAALIQREREREKRERESLIGLSGALLTSGNHKRQSANIVIHCYAPLASVLCPSCSVRIPRRCFSSPSPFLAVQFLVVRPSSTLGLQRGAYRSSRCALRAQRFRRNGSEAAPRR